MDTPSRRRPIFWKPWESPDLTEQLVRRPLTPQGRGARIRLFDKDESEGSSPSLAVSLVENPASSTADFLAKVLWVVENMERFSSSLSARRLTLALQPDLTEADRIGTEWVEITRCSVEIVEGAGPWHPVRLIVSSLQMYQIQVTWPVVRVVRRGAIACANDPHLLELLEELQPNSKMSICPGIPDYDKRYSAIRHPPKSLATISVKGEVVRYESKHCLLMHHTGKQKGFSRDRRYNMCTECKALDSHLLQYASNAAEVSDETKIARTLPSSNYPFSYLSPASQKVRARKLMQERKTLNKQIAKYSNLSVTLDDEQDKQMAEIVATIEENEDLRSQLDEVLLEADQHKEGHGALLQEMWEADLADSEREKFTEDQQRNRTGNQGNRWNLITYRLALAVYTRSPAAYAALKSFNILQLPSKRSLQAFVGANRDPPGVNEKKIAEQRNLYDAIKQQKLRSNKKEPQSKGVLIFDEVKVQSKVVWNSKNNRIVGVAMSLDELCSLHDVYQLLDADFRTHQTTYILQFMWRDITSDFDVIGPYFTCEKSLEMKFLAACVFEAMYVFETYGFHIFGLVCDGASCNLSLLKRLCGKSGRFGSDINSEGGVGDVPASFINPYSGRTTFLIICPSHQLKNMIAALHSSRPQGTKSFERNGVTFGWMSIQKMWERDLRRTNPVTGRQLTNLPGMKESYILRDSWTRLNVKPAKIMQQDHVLQELADHCAATPDVQETLSDLETLKYLRALNKIFERGILSSRRVQSIDAEEIVLLREGFAYFESWYEELAKDKVDPDSTTQTEFLAWQTWDLLRLMFQGFIGLCEHFLAEHPGYFVTPVRINGSAIESYFSQLKYAARGQLSAINYETAQAAVETSKAASTKRPHEADYRDAGVDIHPAQLTKKRKV